MGEKGMKVILPYDDHMQLSRQSYNTYRVKWLPVTTAWRVLRLRMEERPPVMEGSCEYIESAVADSLQGVVLQLGVWARC
jgi:hypothetical protein